MKKYISIFSLITALAMQSCERSDEDTNSATVLENAKPFSSKKEKAKDPSSSAAKDSGTDNLDTGDDDEPRRDKQHWRIIQDTI